MSTAASEVRPPAFVTPQPSFGDAFCATLLGFVIASVLVIAPVLVAHWLGLAGDRFVGLGQDEVSPLSWPYERNGAFSVVANLVVWIEVLAFTALLVRGMLADRVGPLSAVPIFVVLAVTGFAPLLPHGLLMMPGIIALLASAWLIQVAVATTPIRPLPKRTTARLMALFAALLAIPAAYGAAHPLGMGSQFGPQSPKELTFGLRNQGFADMRVTDISLDTPIHGLSVAREPLPFALDGRHERVVRLGLHQAGCGSGGPLPAHAIVRYSLLGSDFTARIPVEVPLKPCARS